ncbi:MAG: hypothetical protein V4819_23805 [Verrucomicrobiota bacterium]
MTRLLTSSMVVPIFSRQLHKDFTHACHACWHAMDATTFRTVFPRQLRFWAFHCTLNALPSFCIALTILKLWKSPSAVAAMLCATATFIVLYATFTSLVEPLADENHVLARSLKLGTKIRSWISGLSLLVAFTPAVSITPDFWCGLISVSLTNALFKSAGGSADLYNAGAGGANAGFSPVYVTTMLEGFILSFILLMISFFTVMFVQTRDRKRVFEVAEPR